ncbi:MAG: efflux RND transporter periplasmic adaptor subunit [Bdellovibrionales bacterium]|nr:efflux RND transporter periplasmic adaptor subunit [Bdellovibrionales bacterium]
MNTSFSKMKNLLCAKVLLTLWLTLTFHVAMAENKKHNHNHEQEQLKKKVEEGHERHADDHTMEHKDDHKGMDNHDEHEEGNRKVGEGKAVIEIHDDKGFRLSNEAYQALKIRYENISGSRFPIPKSALVRVKDEIGVYRFQESFFKLVPVKIHREEKDRYIVNAPLQAGDQVVTQGVELLRVADIYSQDTSEYGHGH